MLSVSLLLCRYSLLRGITDNSYPKVRFYPSLETAILQFRPPRERDGRLQAVYSDRDRVPCGCLRRTKALNGPGNLIEQGSSLRLLLESAVDRISLVQAVQSLFSGNQSVESTNWLRKGLYCLVSRYLTRVRLPFSESYSPFLGRKR